MAFPNDTEHTVFIFCERITLPPLKRSTLIQTLWPTLTPAYVT